MLHLIPTSAASLSFCYRHNSRLVPLTNPLFIRTFCGLLVQANVLLLCFSWDTPFARVGSLMPSDQGFTVKRIQVIGDWKSDAYKQYFDFSFDTMLSVSFHTRFTWFYPLICLVLNSYIPPLPLSMVLSYFVFDLCLQVLWGVLLHFQTVLICILSLQFSINSFLAKHIFILYLGAKQGKQTGDKLLILNSICLFHCLFIYFIYLIFD